MNQRLTLLLAALLTLPLDTACTYALGSHALIEGREYRRDRVAQLTRGMTEQEVRSLLGEPGEERARQQRVTWQYRAVYQQRACEVALFGIIPVQRRPKEQFETTIVFGPKGLETARHVERLPERTLSTDLVANPQSNRRIPKSD